MSEEKMRMRIKKTAFGFMRGQKIRIKTSVIRRKPLHGHIM